MAGKPRLPYRGERTVFNADPALVASLKRYCGDRSLSQMINESMRLHLDTLKIAERRSNPKVS